MWRNLDLVMKIMSDKIFVWQGRQNQHQNEIKSANFRDVEVHVIINITSIIYIYYIRTLYFEDDIVKLRRILETKNNLLLQWRPSQLWHGLKEGEKYIGHQNPPPPPFFSGNAIYFKKLAIFIHDEHSFNNKTHAIEFHHLWCNSIHEMLNNWIDCITTHIT